jgi:hypothetical protein
LFAPNTLIENLLQLKKPKAAMVLDGLFAADIATWPSMDAQTILHYFKLSGVAMGESNVRRGLFELAQLGLLATRKIITRGKGRPAWEYRLGSVSGMAKTLGVTLHQTEASDSVPLTSFKSARAYRASKHYGLLKRLGISQLSRKKLGARLGVGGRSTFNYEKGQNLTVIQRNESQKMSMADVANAPLTRGKSNIFLEVFFERELSLEELAEKYQDFDLNQVTLKREFVRESRYMPYTQFILRRELERGHEVYKLKQITNEYRVN